MTTKLVSSPFGITADGIPVEQLTLDNGILSCSVLTYGAIPHALRIPDQNGIPVDIILGFDTMAEYESQYDILDSLFGRFSNRISTGCFLLRGTTCTLSIINGPCRLRERSSALLHSVWSIEDCSRDHVTLSLSIRNSENPHPGKLHVKISYILQHNTLSIHCFAVSDKVSQQTFADLGFFDLSCQGDSASLAQLLQLYGDSCVPNNTARIPLGTVELVVAPQNPNSNETIWELQAAKDRDPQLLNEYLRQILLMLQPAPHEEKPTIRSYLQQEIEYAQRYFQEHYNEDIQIKDYARSRNMSVSWFLRNFKEVTKRSPAQYLLNIRLENAVNLLKTTSYNVTEISAIIGYNDPFYFSRLFKKHKGVSPTDYRKLSQNNVTELV